MKEMKERRGEICRFDPVGRPSPSTTRDARANISRPYFLGLRSFFCACVCSSFVAIRVLTISHFSQRPLGALPLLVDGRTRSCNPGEMDGISMYQSFKVHHRRNKKKEVQSHQSVESWTVHTKYSKLFPLGPLSSPFFSYLLLLL